MVTTPGMNPFCIAERCKLDAVAGRLQVDKSDMSVASSTRSHDHPVTVCDWAALDSSLNIESAFLDFSGTVSDAILEDSIRP
jgi:hypothetical protein